jgi:uncharacterized membrane protein YhaH (DUF805 family)
MKPIDAIKSVLTNYTNFAGRARRAEYWWFFLFSSLLNMFFSQVLPSSTGVQLLSWLISLALLLPSIAVGVRRLHDTGKSGWLLLIALTIIGVIPLIIFLATPGNPDSNKYGPSPKAA